MGFVLQVACDLVYRTVMGKRAEISRAVAGRRTLRIPALGNALDGRSESQSANARKLLPAKLACAPGEPCQSRSGRRPAPRVAAPFGPGPHPAPGVSPKRVVPVRRRRD